jgi:SulP family sulfate permease
VQRLSAARALRDLYVPKLVTVIRQGYGFEDLRHDLGAGLTVAIVALPLSMALAIASGATPEKGLHTAIVAGFLISLLGGSRVQIGGPTAAFVPIVFGIIERFGYGGLTLCTLLAGLMLILAGALRLGTLLKYIPTPVITGFTAGIAVSIFSSQVKDLLGLHIDHVPGDFLGRWSAYWAALPSWTPAAAVLSASGVALILLLRRYRPSLPGFLIVVTAGALGVALFHVPVETIGTRFGSIPATLPLFAIPHIPFERTAELFPSAFTIAFLAGVESLLSAVVADGMTGGRHRSNCELVAQGVANVATSLFGALPATGALARTATNVRAGARSPIAGIAHAVFLLLFMLVLAPVMTFIPLSVLAAILVVVAWHMAEVDSFRSLLSGPVGDRFVLLTTFVLTVAFDLTVAIEAGIVLAAFLFMHRMAEVVGITSGVDLLDEDRADPRSRRPDQRARLPAGVEVFQIAGPLFFAVANRLDDVLNQFPEKPRVFILRMRLVPLIDASGVAALKRMLERCAQQGTAVILSGLQGQPLRILPQLGVVDNGTTLRFAPSFEDALALARQPSTSARPPGTGNSNNDDPGQAL